MKNAKLVTTDSYYLYFDMPKFTDRDFLKEWLSAQRNKLKENGIVEYLISQFNKIDVEQKTECIQLENLINSTEYKLISFDVKYRKSNTYIKKFNLSSPRAYFVCTFENINNNKKVKKQIAFKDIKDLDVIMYLLFCKALLPTSIDDGLFIISDIVKARNLDTDNPDNPLNITRYTDITEMDVFILLVYDWKRNDKKFYDSVFNIPNVERGSLLVNEFEEWRKTL